MQVCRNFASLSTLKASHTSVQFRRSQLDSKTADEDAHKNLSMVMSHAERRSQLISACSERPGLVRQPQPRGEERRKCCPLPAAPVSANTGTGAHTPTHTLAETGREGRRRHACGSKHMPATRKSTQCLPLPVRKAGNTMLGLCLGWCGSFDRPLTYFTVVVLFSWGGAGRRAGVPFSFSAAYVCDGKMQMEGL